MEQVEELLQGERSSHELLIRIDERTKATAAAVVALQQNYVHKQEFAPFKKAVEDFQDIYVQNKEFAPIRNGFYVVVSLVITTVVGAILALVVKK